MYVHCGTVYNSKDLELTQMTINDRHFLQKVEAGKVAIKEFHLHSTNLIHLRAIVESAKNLEEVVGVSLVT